VIVLKSGIDGAKWKAASYAKSDILTYTQTDSNGEYVLPVKAGLRNMPLYVYHQREGLSQFVG